MMNIFDADKNTKKAMGIALAAWLLIFFFAVFSSSRGQELGDKLDLKSVILVVAPKKSIPLSSDKPTLVEVRLVSLKDETGKAVQLPKDVNLDAFRAKAIARSVKYNGQNIGQVGLVELSSKAVEGKSERLSVKEYAYQWPLEKDTLGSQDRIEIKVAPISFLKILNDLKAQDTQDKIFEARTKEDEKSEERVAGGNAGAKTSAGGGGGSLSAGKSSATDYSPPSTSDSAPIIDVRITTDGCEIRIDMAQGVAIQQTKSITTEDGKVTDTSECGDSSTRYKLIKSYACEDIVNESASLVQGQYKWYYDRDGTKVEVSGCQKDADRFFKIVEEIGDCSVKLDFGRNEAIVQTELTYIDTNNERIQVRGCEASSMALSMAIEETVNGCAIRKVDGEEVQFTRKVYMKDGVVFEASPCSGDSGEIVRTTTDGCDIRIDFAQGVAIEQVRTYVTVGDGETETSACTDSNRRYVLQKTYDVCEKEKVDEDAKSVNATYEYYYTFGASRVPLEGCYEDENIVYAIEERIGNCDAKIREDKAYPSVIRYYKNRKGEDIQVRDCGESRTLLPIQIVSTALGCEPITDDTGLTKAQEKLIYTLNGKTVEVRACFPNGLSWWDKIDDCELRVDKQKEAVIQQHRRIHFENGRQTSKEFCRDSEKKYALTISYETCDYVLDSPIEIGSYAYAAREMWYENDLGEKKIWQACTKDEEKRYKIQEELNTCSFDTDVDKGEVTVQSTLVYYGREGVKTEARGCEKSDSTNPNPITMTRELGECSFEHDFDQNHSKKTGKWIFEYNGSLYFGSTCLAFGDELSHKKIYQKNGEDVCDLLRTDKDIIRQYRIEITDNNISQYITECTSDEEATSVMKTTDGCNDVRNWDHQVNNGKSYGKSRRYYISENKKVYISEVCSTDLQEEYDHQVEIVGYQRNDTSLFDYPLKKITIDTGKLAGIYVVRESIVIPGEAQLPYEKLRDENRVTDEDPTYSRCEEIKNTVNYEVYKRSDGTEYDKKIGPGKEKRTDVCVTDTVTKELHIGYMPEHHDDYPSRRLVKQEDYYQTWTKTMVSNPGSGKIISVTYNKKSGEDLPHSIEARDDDSSYRVHSVRLITEEDIKAGEVF